MNDLLQRYGIDKTNKIYEFEAVNIDWWNSDTPTFVEFQIETDKMGNTIAQVLFTNEKEEEVHSGMVFFVHYMPQKKQLVQEGLISPMLKEKVAPQFDIPFDKQKQAYTFQDYEMAYKLTECIVQLLPKEKPKFIFDMEIDFEQ